MTAFNQICIPIESTHGCVTCRRYCFLMLDRFHQIAFLWSQLWSIELTQWIEMPELKSLYSSRSNARRPARPEMIFLARWVTLVFPIFLVLERSRPADVGCRSNFYRPLRMLKILIRIPDSYQQYQKPSGIKPHCWLVFVNADAWPVVRWANKLDAGRFKSRYEPVEVFIARRWYVIHIFVPNDSSNRNTRSVRQTFYWPS